MESAIEIMRFLLLVLLVVPVFHKYNMFHFVISDLLCDDIPNVKFLPDNAFTGSGTALTNYKPWLASTRSAIGYMCRMPCWIIVDLGKSIISSLSSAYILGGSSKVAPVTYIYTNF